MYDVVKFIQKQKIQVLAVPTTWIQTDYILWPEQLSDDAVDRMRIEGIPYNGPTRAIPMIMKGRFAHFQQAEATANDLMKRHASDEDYAAGERTAADFNNSWRENSVIQPQSTAQQQQPTSQQQQPTSQQQQTTSQQHQHAPQQQQQSSQQQQPILIDLREIDRPHWAPMTTLETDRYCTNGQTVKVEHFEEFVGLSGNSAVLTIGAFKNEMDSFKHDLNTFIEKTVEKCFHTNFDRFTPLLEKLNKVDRIDIPADSLLTPVEKRRPIRNEEELDEWNAELADEELCRQYLQYFAKIIQPNKHAGKGDNACYIIVDCLFTREFWNQFTWTGINRGMKKSSRGFREFGNVTRLLLNIVRLGDPSYNAERLENFCKTRLFRYSRARSVSQKLRKSACRPARAVKSVKKAQNTPMVMDVDFEVTKTEIGFSLDTDGSGLDL